MYLLIASLLSLVVGSLLAFFLQQRKQTAHGLDAFVMVSVGGLVCFHILPHSVAHAGVWAVGAALAGIVIPIIAERSFASKEGTVRGFTWGLALSAIALHAVMDGLAVAPELTDGELVHHIGHTHHIVHEHGVGHALAFAVILHRIPVALVVWWLVRNRFGLAAALGMLTLIGSGSIVGFVSAESLLTWFEGPSLSVFQALVAGTLLHVTLGHGIQHRGYRDCTCDSLEQAAVQCGKKNNRNGEYGEVPNGSGSGIPWDVASAIGGAAGVGVLILLLIFYPVETVSHGALGMNVTLLILLRLIAWPLVAGVTVAAAAGALVAESHWQTLMTDGVVGVGLSLVLLGGELTAAVVIVTGVLLMAGLVWVGKFGSECGKTGLRQWCTKAYVAYVASGDPKARNCLNSLLKSLRRSLRNVVDESGGWLVLGIVSASVFEALFDASVWEWWGALMMVLVALVMRLRLVAWIPIAAVLLGKGVSPAAVVAVISIGYCALVFDRGSWSKSGPLIGWLLAAAGIIVFGDRLASGLRYADWRQTSMTKATIMEWVGIGMIAVLYGVSMLRLGTHRIIDMVVTNGILYRFSRNRETCHGTLDIGGE